MKNPLAVSGRSARRSDAPRCGTATGVSWRAGRCRARSRSGPHGSDAGSTPAAEASAGRGGGHLVYAATSSGFTVDLWEERRAHPTWDHYGGVMPRRAPHGELAAGLGCYDELSLAPDTCSGSTTSTQPFGSPLLSIHHRVDGFLALSFHPPSPGGTAKSSSPRSVGCGPSSGGAPK